MPIYQPVVMIKEEQIQIAETARIDSFVKIEGGNGVVIEDHVHVSSFCHLNIGCGELVMKQGSAISSHAAIVTGSNMLDGVSMSAAAPKELQSVARGKVVVEQNAIIFTGAIILPNITIGRGAVVGAGAVVTKDVPPFEIWVGNPARRIGKREDIEASRNGHGFEDM